MQGHIRIAENSKVNKTSNSAESKLYTKRCNENSIQPTWLYLLTDERDLLGKVWFSEWSYKGNSCTEITLFPLQ